MNVKLSCLLFSGNLLVTGAISRLLESNVIQSVVGAVCLNLKQMRRVGFIL